jgi:plasmid stabilization system protein ParE
MNRYDIVYSDDADRDLNNLFDVIFEEYAAPLTAYKYVEGVVNTVKSLSVFPEAYPIDYNQSLAQYGNEVRRINYKKMTIIYIVHNDTVYIQRIMAGSLIH